jgi:hypothetical protein
MSTISKFNLIKKNDLRNYDKNSSQHNMNNNNYSHSEKIKIPLYNNLLYIETELNDNENEKYKYLTRNNEKYLTELTSYHNLLTQKYINDLKTKQPKNIYIKKNIIISPERSNSETDFKKIFQTKLSNTQRSHNNIGNKIKKEIKKNMEPEEPKNNQNIININLIKEKNNYIENNIINEIYINKNKNNISKKNNLSLTNSINRNEQKVKGMNLTERNSFQRRNNYIYHYFTNNESFKNTTAYIKKEPNTQRNIIKKKVNNLPKVNKKKVNDYNETFIIKIQSVFRGYLLNKSLDKILRHYINIKAADKIIKNIYIKKIFELLKNIKQWKRYLHQNIYYNRNRNNSSNRSLNKNKDYLNKELQFKINELINEKNELQSNYKNLKEFMNHYKLLIIENTEMKKEIDNLKQKLNLLLGNERNHKINKNKIQKQKDIKIIGTQNIYLNQNSNINEFFTLGKELNDNQKDINELTKYKLKYLIKNKEFKTKNLLHKYFYKLYYYDFFNPNIKSNKKNNNVCVINKRYNNIENQNNMVTHISIKTLSDNSSVFNDGKWKNLSIINPLNMTDEENKRK